MEKVARTSGDAVLQRYSTIAKQVPKISILQFVDMWIKSTVEPSYMKFIKKKQEG